MADLLQVILAFGLIIVIHEAGHFVAARWAGIRVLAFAVGFGSAACSFRKGLGFRWGSSEEEYLALLAARGTRGAGGSGGVVGGVFPTEYRLNVLPLGGYVKMLGQDDADPSARSDEADSYQSCPPWKRMVVISAGVIANIVSAALLYIIVFHVGLPTEAPRVGMVATGSPAALAVADNAGSLHVAEVGLQPGDTIVTINDEAVAAFKDITLAAAMAARGSELRVVVKRPGLVEPLRFRITPKEDSGTRMLQMGFGPAVSGVLEGVRASAGERARRAEELTRVGYAGLEPGMRLTAIGASMTRGFGETALDARSIDAAAKASGGSPVTLTFEGENKTVRVEMKPGAALQTDIFADSEDKFAVNHLAGLVPVMAVRSVEANSGGAVAGLKAGDVFARLGDVEWPGVAEGIAQIRRVKSGTIDVDVLRDGARVSLGKVAVKGGVIGFMMGDTSEQAALVARWPGMRHVGPAPTAPAFGEADAKPVVVEAATPSGAGLHLPAGTRITGVNGVPVTNLREARAELQRAAAVLPAGPMSATLDVQLPLASGPVQQRVEWRLAATERDAIAGLGWVSTLSPAFFQYDEVVLKGTSVGDSLMLGLRETKKVMLSTYLTFARLVQGTVKVEHLKGPVGIATVGTQLADRGFVWLLFFMAIVSVNLAVINFLPLPIVDGGHFLFLVYEQITGKPVSVLVQNIATMAGLVMIGTVFLITTYNDIAALLWN